MTWNTTHVIDKGGYISTMILKRGRCVRVVYLHMCVKFQVSIVNSSRENSYWGGGRHFCHNSHFFKVFLSFYVFESWFSLSMFPNNFRSLLMTGANDACPVLFPKNTFVEDRCQFYHGSLQLANFCRNCRISYSAIASVLYFQYSCHPVVGPFHILVHDPNQIIHFQLSHAIFVPFITHIPFRQIFFGPSSPDRI